MDITFVRHGDAVAQTQCLIRSCRLVFESKNKAKRQKRIHATNVETRH